MIIGDVCMKEERNFIEIEGADGAIEVVELVGTINSKR